MAKGKFTKEEVQKLWSAMVESRRVTKPFRDTYHDLLKEYTGPHYGDKDKLRGRTPLNVIRQYVKVLQFRLVPQRPAVSVGVLRGRQLKPMARNLELALNHLAREIDLTSTLHSTIVVALFHMGVVKIGMNKSKTVEVGGELHDMGQPFVDVVGPDDWVHDVTARTWEEMSFCGNRYRLPLQVVRDCGLYKEELVKQLLPSNDLGRNEQGDLTAENLSSRPLDNGEWEEYVELWDIYLPRHNCVITIAHDQLGGEVLREMEWDGPEGGPFRCLRFTRVPDNVFPIAPATDIYDLHLAINDLQTKIIESARAEKNLGAVPLGGEKDWERVQNANDGDVIPVQDPRNIQELHTGGASPETMIVNQSLLELADRFAGNLRTLAGLGPSADTARQEDLIASSSDAQIAYMSNQVLAFIEQIYRDLAFYLWNDPLVDIPLVKRVGGIDIPVTFNADQREGDLLDYNIKISPYSMQPDSPQRKLQVITDVFTQIISPMLPIIGPQGGVPNTQVLLEMIAEYTDTPEIRDLVTWQNPVVGEKGAVVPPDGSSKAPITTRTYRRENVAGGRNPDSASAMMSMLQSGGGRRGRGISANRGESR